MTTHPVRVFISYQRDQEAFICDLTSRIEREASVRDAHLPVNVWHDRKIVAGGDWDGSIGENMREAEVYIAVATEKFFKSPYITRDEIPVMVQRWNAGHPSPGKAAVLPLQYEKVSKNETPFRTMQFACSSKALSELVDADYEDELTKFVDEVVDQIAIALDLRHSTAVKPAIQTHMDAIADLSRTLVADPQQTPEDSLKPHVTKLVEAVASALGFTDVKFYTEYRDGHTRVDIAVRRKDLLVGVIELKSVNKSGNPDNPHGWSKHDKDQWSVLRDHPNLIYTNGTTWTRSQGASETLTPVEVTAASDDVANALISMFSEFLRWSPIVPSQPRPLAAKLAPLARLLRDDVLRNIEGGGPLAALLDEWRYLLFADANADSFADAYAQTFTYALLLARLEGAPVPLRAEEADDVLQAHGQSFLGAILRVLGQDEARNALDSSVTLLERTMSAIDPAKFNKGGNEWVYFYEHFLSKYDPSIRDSRGVYYTPVEVVDCQVRLAQHVLRDHLGMHGGFADPGVTTLDPATGTGSYLLSAIRHALTDAPAKAEAATQIAKNLYGFELLVGPYAVAHLRITQALDAAGASLGGKAANIVLTDTLAAPSDTQPQMSLFSKPLAEEQYRASQVKQPQTPVTVIIGNPPYNRAKTTSEGQTGGMVRHGDDGATPLLDTFIEPLRAMGKGGSAKNLYNDYVYFWRWAIWKACEQHPDEPAIVSFITAASYLRGPGFAGMRQVMREQFDEVWVIDLGGEGHEGKAEPNVFDILTPVVITIAVRRRRVKGQHHTRHRTCAVRYVRVPGQTRDDLTAYLDSLTELDPADPRWSDAPTQASARFVPDSTNATFGAWPALTDIFPWNSRGIQFSRTWPVSQTKEVLQRRWKALLSATADRQGDLLYSTTDVTMDAAVKSFTTGKISTPLNQLRPDADPERYDKIWFRSFDTQYAIADRRVIDRPRPALWLTHGEKNVYLTAMERPGDGPAVIAAPYVPDMNAYANRGGGVFPVMRTPDEANVTAGLLDALGVSLDDLVAYVLGLTSHRKYLEKFGEDARQSEAIRVPVTKDTALFERAANLGRRAMRASTDWQRCVPLNRFGQPVSRPKGAASLSATDPIPTDSMPDTFAYDREAHTLRVGAGLIENVSAEVWDYSVSDMPVVNSWLSYRMKNRSGRKSSDLDRDIIPQKWDQSLALLHLLWSVEEMVSLDTDGDALLGDIIAGPLWGRNELPQPSPQQQRTPRTPTAPSVRRRQKEHLPVPD